MCMIIISNNSDTLKNYSVKQKLDLNNGSYFM